MCVRIKIAMYKIGSLPIFSSTLTTLFNYTVVNAKPKGIFLRTISYKIKNMKTVKLRKSNFDMPLVGLGTWQSTDPNEVEKAVTTALQLGYTSIDTAFNYNNEESIGKAINAWLEQKKGERSQLLITTKLPHIANKNEDVEKFLKLSLNKLKLNYVDLYLIHVPFGFERDENTMSPKVESNGNYVLDMKTDHISIWKAMESCVDKGLTKNIGLSNFNERQIETIYNSARIKPQVLQVECHLYLQQTALREFCDKKNIVVTAYSPLGSPGAQKHFSSKYNYDLQNFPDIIGHPVVQQIASDHGKTSSQILLRYLIQQNIVVIPKSSNPDRIKANLEIFDFELSEQEMDTLKKIDRGEEGRVFDFLFWKGVTNHPEYPFQIKK